MADILHISRTMGQGGAEKITYQLAVGLKDMFNRVFVVSSGGILEEKLKENNVSHLNIFDLETKNPFKILSNYKKMSNLIRTNNIKIVHVHHRMGLLYALLLKKINKRISIIYTAHNIFYDKKKLYKYLTNYSYNIAVGESVKRNLENFGIYCNEVIYNSISNPNKKINFDIRKSNVFKVACIARLSKQKGVEFFIEAIVQLLKDGRNIEALIVGTGEDEKVLMEKVIRSECEKNIVFLGYREDVLNIIASVDLVVLPSLWEGYPLTPIETFMMGKTIVATNIEGTNEIVNDDNGILIPPKSVSSIKKAITSMIDNPKKKRYLEKNAYEFYCRNFSYEVFLEKYRVVYQNESVILNNE